MGARSAPRVAWVTGASSGIGEALALRLAREGWQVAASARSAGVLNRFAAANDAISAFPLDVSDRHAVRNAAIAIEAALGPIRLAVLNAGLWQKMGAADFSADICEHIWCVNYAGVANCLEAVMPSMMARGEGHIVVVASLSGYAGLPGAAAYGPTKAALINLAECLKPELDRAGVRLQIVNPGFVATRMTRSNDFSMPHLMSAEAAAQAIAKGLASARFEIRFPAPLVARLRLLRTLPYPLFFRLTRRLIGPGPGRSGAA